MDEVVERTFESLLAGKIDYLQIAIAPAATTATRETPNVGVWRLNREQLVTIIAPMILERPTRFLSTDSVYRKNQGHFTGKTAEQVAALFDEVGIENRFFRLHPEVARWIDGTEPVDVILDYMLL